MNHEKISIQIDSNERGSDRANGLILAAAKDPRFSVPSFAELDVDVCFKLGENAYLAELKEPADYVSSVLGKDGHLYQQYLSMAEAGCPCMILFLGSDNDVTKAIIDALQTRYKGKELAFQIGSYEKRLIDFEANAEALGCPVERWSSMPYSRLLSRVAKRLEGKASLMDYRPRPSEEERKIAALAMLLGNGIGPEKAKAILEKFDLKLESKNEIGADGMIKDSYKLTDCKGLGPKLAARIREKIEVSE